MALRQLRRLGLACLFLRVVAFAAAVPLLMRLKLPVLHRLLERRIAAAANAGRDLNRVGHILRCVQSALSLGAPLVRPGCLTRGLTLYYFLRRAGREVTLCFGARCQNGQLTEGAGHCWLEQGGRPFLERGNPRHYSVPIYSLPAKSPHPGGDGLTPAA